VCVVAWLCINRLRLATRTRWVSRSVHHAESRGLSVGFCWVSTGGAPPPPPAQTAPLPLRSRLSTWGSGGTRTRTGDTMIFSHVLRPLAMRFYRISERISVHRVSLDIARCRPYCCTTVDIPLFTMRSTGSRTSTSARLTRLFGYSRPPLTFGDVSGSNHKETSASCVVSPTSSTFNASKIGLLTRLRGEGQRTEADERTRTAFLLIMS
jgi:hypothetical protein